MRYGDFSIDVHQREKLLQMAQAQGEQEDEKVYASSHYYL